MMQGSGKTLAFGLPILHHVLVQREKAAQSDTLEEEQRLQALIFAPTRELALQASVHKSSFAPLLVWCWTTR